MRSPAGVHSIQRLDVGIWLAAVAGVKYAITGSSGFDAVILPEARSICADKDTKEVSDKS